MLYVYGIERKKKEANFRSPIDANFMREREILSVWTALRAIYRLGSPAVILVVLPVLLQLRRRPADETRLLEIPLDRAPDLPAINHRRALVVQQWRVLAHHVQQM